MTAQKPSKAIQRIYNATKAAYGEHWDAAVRELEPAIIMIMRSEGHSDPMGFLKAKKDGQPDTILKSTETAAKNLSLARANKVRDGVMTMLATAC